MENLWLFIFYIAIGVILFGLGIPLSLRKVKQNRLYGFRTKRTLADESIWYDANAYAGKLMIITGLVIAGGATVLIYAGKNLDMNSLALILLAILVIPITIMIILSARKLKSL